MPVSDAAVEMFLSRLQSVRPVTHRKMFGGVGLYCDAVFFAVIDDDRLYFKVDDSTRESYEASGMEQWVPDPRTGAAMPYFEVPKSVVEDDARFGDWIDDAVEVAMRKKSKR
jgi:DNA transformation protein